MGQTDGRTEGQLYRYINSARERFVLTRDKNERGRCPSRVKNESP